MKRTFAAVVLYLFAASASAAGLADITNKDAVSGLRQALTDGAAAAVGKLGVENGFFGNTRVKIPLPESLQKVEGLMRAMGMKRQADELELAMNRAAETAVAEATPLLVDAVKQMSVQDAKGILTGGETSAISTTSTMKMPNHTRSKPAFWIIGSTTALVSTIIEMPSSAVPRRRARSRSIPGAGLRMSPACSGVSGAKAIASMRPPNSASRRCISAFIAAKAS